MAKIFTEQENQAWANQLPGKMTSACLVLCSNGKVLMVKANYKDHWTFPSGIVDANESPKAAALRETFEETGIEIPAEQCELLTVVYTAAETAKHRDRYNFAFQCRLPEAVTPPAIPNDEIEAYEWVDIEEVAARSNHKGSYQNFQRLLLAGNTHEPYIEVHTA